MERPVKHTDIVINSRHGCCGRRAEPATAEGQRRRL